MARARKIDEEERTLRKRQQEERERFREKQLELQRKLEEEKMKKIEMSAKAREEYKEKMRAATVIEEPDEPKSKKGDYETQQSFSLCSGYDNPIISERLQIECLLSSDYSRHGTKLTFI